MGRTVPLEYPNISPCWTSQYLHSEEAPLASEGPYPPQLSTKWTNIPSHQMALIFCIKDLFPFLSMYHNQNLRLNSPKRFTHSNLKTLKKQVYSLFLHDKFYKKYVYIYIISIDSPKFGQIFF